jgi:hypothetical protein
MNRAVVCVGLALALPIDAGALADVATPDGSHTVIVLRASNADTVAAEATARVQGELGAAGFHVVILPVSADSASTEVKTAGRELGAAGAFAILVHREQGVQVADIWVSDRIRQVTIVESAHVTESDHERESEVLAVRAVELLRASLAELWLQPEAPPLPPAGTPAAVPTLAREVPKREAPVRPAFSSGIGLGVGAGVLDSFQGVGAIWLPSLLLTYGWDTGFSAELSLRGLGPPVEVGAAAGTAKTELQVASVDLLKTWWPRARLVPLACVGVGAQHVRVSGTAVAPFAGTTSDVWAPWTSAGLGAAVSLYSGLSLMVQARAARAWPPTAVRIADVDVGHFGAPSLLVDTHLLGVFP